MSDLYLNEADEAMMHEHQRLVDAGAMEPRAFRARSGNLLVNGNWEWPASAQDLFEAFPIQATWCCQNERVVPEWMARAFVLVAWFGGCWAVGYVMGLRG